MQEENPKKKRRILDKVVMGAIIGGAIGSVLGATIAPNKGKQTREEIREAAIEATKTSKTLFQKLKTFFSRRKKSPEPPLKKIPSEHVDTSNEPR